MASEADWVGRYRGCLIYLCHLLNFMQFSSLSLFFLCLVLVWLQDGSLVSMACYWALYCMTPYPAVHHTGRTMSMNYAVVHAVWSLRAPAPISAVPVLTWRSGRQDSSYRSSNHLLSIELTVLLYSCHPGESENDSGQERSLFRSSMLQYVVYSPSCHRGHLAGASTRNPLFFSPPPILLSGMTITHGCGMR